MADNGSTDDGGGWLIVFDWGEDEPPTDADEAEIIDGGWCEAPDAPVWAFLPAVWPRQHRAWLPDVEERFTTHVVSVGDQEISRSRVPWSEHDHASQEADINQLLAEAGVPARPPGRRWYLRLPPGCARVRDLVESLSTAAQVEDIEVSANPRFALFVAEQVDRLFE